jgi:ribonuclease HI
MSVTIHIDGAARGNPGPAAFAYVITPDEGPAIEEHGRLGQTTNNVAEYSALVRALERAGQLGADRLLIFSDSELLVKQMNGLYRVKNDDLRDLHDQAKRLMDRFERVTIRHVPRSENRRADRLCNEALDGDGRTTAAPADPLRRRPMAPASREEAAAEEAILCLKAAAAAWAVGNPEMPPAEDVWSQLWSILEEHGVLASARPRR